MPLVNVSNQNYQGSAKFGKATNGFLRDVAFMIEEALYHEVLAPLNERFNGWFYSSNSWTGRGSLDRLIRSGRSEVVERIYFSTNLWFRWGPSLAGLAFLLVGWNLRMEGASYGLAFGFRGAGLTCLALALLSWCDIHAGWRHWDLAYRHAFFTGQLPDQEENFDYNHTWWRFRLFVPLHLMLTKGIWKTHQLRPNLVGMVDEHGQKRRWEELGKKDDNKSSYLMLDPRLSHWTAERLQHARWNARKFAFVEKYFRN